jgi:hypothetical protein
MYAPEFSSDSSCPVSSAIRLIPDRTMPIADSDSPAAVTRRDVCRWKSDAIFSDSSATAAPATPRTCFTRGAYFSHAPCDFAAARLFSSANLAEAAAFSFSAARTSSWAEICSFDARWIACVDSCARRASSL